MKSVFWKIIFHVLHYHDYPNETELSTQNQLTIKFLQYSYLFISPYFNSWCICLNSYYSPANAQMIRQYYFLNYISLLNFHCIWYSTIFNNGIFIIFYKLLMFHYILIILSFSLCLVLKNVTCLNEWQVVYKYFNCAHGILTWNNVKLVALVLTFFWTPGACTLNTLKRF